MNRAPSFSSICIVVLSCLAAACLSTETGNPPLQEENGVVPESFSAIDLPTMQPGFVISGEVTNSVPPGSRVVVLPLDLLNAPSTEAEIGDGVEFDVPTPSGANQWRIQVVAPDGTRYQPIDVSYDDSGDPGLVPPTASCLDIPTAVATSGSPRRAEVEVTNTCDAPAMVTSVFARTDMAALSTSTFGVEPGASERVVVELSGAVPTGGEELIIWDANGPQYTTVFDPAPIDP